MDEIKKILREWATKMVSKYEWLKIRFEFSEDRRKYLVSFYYSEELDDYHPFFSEAMAFEDEMEERYGYDAPLFCDEEELFKLSDKAEGISASPKSVDQISLDAMDFCWNVQDFEMNMNEYYNLAA